MSKPKAIGPRPRAEPEPKEDLGDLLTKIEQGLKFIRVGASAARQTVFALVAGIPGDQVSARMRQLLNELKADEAHYQKRRAQWQE